MDTLIWIILNCIWKWTRLREREWHVSSSIYFVCKCVRMRKYFLSFSFTFCDFFQIQRFLKICFRFDIFFLHCEVCHWKLMSVDFCIFIISFSKRVSNCFLFVQWKIFQPSFFYIQINIGTFLHFFFKYVNTQ